MTNANTPSGSPTPPRSAPRLLLHLAVIAVVGTGVYLLAGLSLSLADRGGWLSGLGWTAFAAIVVTGALLVRRLCCLRRVHRPA